MGHVMHLFELLLSRLFVTGEFQFRMQLHSRDRQPALFVFFHVTDRVVDVFVEQKFLLTSNGKEREHVTARKGSHESLFGIDVLWIAKIYWSSGGRHFMPSIEFPAVIAIISLILEVGRRALPRERHFMFGHLSV